jgi:DNA processing protein
MSGACDACLRRTWLLARLSRHLEVQRGSVEALLALEDDVLIEAVAGERRAGLVAERSRFEPAGYRAGADGAGVELVCRCDPSYPACLTELTAPPAVLHVLGGVDRLFAWCSPDAVAVVGSRAASEYGIEVARSLGRGLAAAGLTVVSGMALGIDSAAHEGALDAAGRTVAVLPGAVDRPYPATKRRLHRRIAEHGVAVSEIAPGPAIARWMFPARNRTIAALGRVTVVVEAAERSGALVTARLARELGRELGAVPGRVTSLQAAGTNELLAGGATIVRDAQDVLDLLYGAGARSAPPIARRAPDEAQAGVLGALADGLDPASAAARTGLEPDAALVALAGLELEGWVRRSAGGRYTVIP